MKTKITAVDLFNELKSIDWEKTKGRIHFELANTKVVLTTLDTVGITLQYWLKQYLIDKNYYFREPIYSQISPDFYLSEANDNDLLEIKAFHFRKTPAFDIANFESYCDEIKTHPFKLYADYLIFGYEMDALGNIWIEDIWLQKIWEIAGKSQKYPLRTQIKRNMIYNIRPNSGFKLYKKPQFESEKEFINAIFETLRLYKSDDFAHKWLLEFKNNYFLHFHKEFNF
ncbi:NgoBV family restriction endonuclease [Mycoplasma seminis]|uniref:NgoBV family restriction endonuclease n=1 Tax=Mycoplasma seminis TaxID=512749 RepID=A0ABY9HAH5_9MOLU|nr:NgoBV family restriction endonuclease [Mycoplasma seminis]WLP85185.1 NgoBV family restriction endonuclease [Mycoplasma seminis]